MGPGGRGRVSRARRPSLEETVAPEIQIVASAADLASEAAVRFLAAARHSVKERGRFVSALSGGDTPRAVHAEIARQAGDLDWDRIHLFWGDERCVPPNDPESNYRMARETLLGRIEIPGGNVHRWRAEFPPERAADDYERQLKAAFRSQGFPVFDFVFLGLGTDGHTASLFPDTLAVAEMDRSAVANFVSRLNAWRLTLTYPVFNTAREIVFLVSGSEKREIFRQIREGRQDLPASRIQGAEVVWLADAAAAGTS